MWVVLIQSTEGLNGTKSGQRKDSLWLCLTELGQQFSAFGPPGSQTFGLEVESIPLALQLSGLQTIPLAFLGLQPAEGESWDFSDSRIT